VKQVAEYRKHAEECRQLAATATSDFERRTLLEMAETWERLARMRKQQLGQTSD